VGPIEVIVLLVAAVVALFVVSTLIRSVRVVPQQRQDVVERLGRFHRVLKPGMNLLMPFADSVRSKVDMREQVVNHPPHPVITSDNVGVSIHTVLYFRVVDPVRATYEISDFFNASEQLTATTLRNLIGSLDLERALTSRDDVNTQLRSVLDEATERWGIKVTRVEIKAPEPPPTVRESMEKQMRAERDRRAAILNAEGIKQSQILTAQGEQQAAILRAEGEKQARILQAEGQAKAIRSVFEAIHKADPDPKLLAYQYLQTLPQIAAGQSNKVWIIPAELTRALDQLGGALGGSLAGLRSAMTPQVEQAPAPPPEDKPSEPAALADEPAAVTEEPAKNGGDGARTDETTGLRELPAPPHVSPTTLLGGLDTPDPIQIRPPSAP